MRKRKRRFQPPLLMFAELAIASWETVMHRSRMMAEGSCSAAEYRRMLTEKLRAAERSALALMKPRGLRLDAALRPWHRRARANARRLRRR